MLFAAVIVASTVYCASAASNSLNEASPAQLARGVLTSPSDYINFSVHTGETLDDGYVYVNFYDGLDCIGAAIGVTGYPTNQCLKLFDTDSGAAIGSFIYQCSDCKLCCPVQLFVSLSLCSLFLCFIPPFPFPLFPPPCFPLVQLILF
jgi:hypothetical protein